MPSLQKLIIGLKLVSVLLHSSFNFPVLHGQYDSSLIFKISSLIIKTKFSYPFNKSLIRSLTFLQFLFK